MASSSAPVHPARYLSVFLLMLVGVYLLVFLTGDKRAAPKLGIDLTGRHPRHVDRAHARRLTPSREALSQAQQIISARVNGLGVSGSEVVVDGDNLVITVPGNDGSEARNLGQTARLFIRPVLNSMPAQGANRSRRPHQPAGGAAGGWPPDRRPDSPHQPHHPHPRRQQAGRVRNRGPIRRTHPSRAAPPSPAAARDRAPAGDAPPADEPAPARIRAKTSPSASRRKRSGGRTPASTSRWSPCSSRPAAATRRTFWPATTTRLCPWWPARPTIRLRTCSGPRSSVATRSRTPRLG